MPRSRLLVVRLLTLAAYLVLFVVAIELMCASFAVVGGDAARHLIASTTNPFVGLFIGILTTSVVQSSSITTSIAVSLVAAGGLTLDGALPIVLGANVGTSVTNTVVALGSISRPIEFRRAVEAATVHDFFNILSVLLLFPMELLFGGISVPAAWLTEGASNAGMIGWFASLEPFSGALLEAAVTFTGRHGFVLLGFGVLLLVVSMRALVQLLRSLVLARLESLLHRYVFQSAMVALGWGILLTFLVQSSSVTTSLMVPLVAAGLLTARQTYPYVVGANVGTTFTAIIAAFVAISVQGGGEQGGAALNLAFAHLVFNLMGMVVLLPVGFLREIPIRLAEILGKAAERRRYIAVVYVVLVFILIPVMAIIITS